MEPRRGLANYAMALDERDHRLFIATRISARLIVFDTRSGKSIASHPVADDRDDIFFDERRHRIYTIGGGEISIVDQKDSDHYVELERLKTASGARTFSPDLDRLFVVIRKTGSRSAEIRVYSPGD